MNYIIFDGDGTLWDSSRGTILFMEYLFAKYLPDIPFTKGAKKGYEITREEMSVYENQWYGSELDFFFHRSIQNYLPSVNAVELKHRIIARLFQSFQKKYEYPLAEQIITEMENSWAAFYSLFPGMYEILGECKKKEIPCVLLTNGFELLQRKKIKQTKLEFFFDKIIISEEVGISKPDLDIFKKAMGEGQGIMIGDSLEHDILPAKELGLETFHFQGEDSVEDVGALLHG
ncbi:MAG: HAD family hydrolase [Tissierellia bacterium]|nr:HAD family hydrolase [Tissierellia bacterium]